MLQRQLYWVKKRLYKEIDFNNTAKNFLKKFGVPIVTLETKGKKKSQTFPKKK